MDLRTNSDYFSTQYYFIGFYNQGRECLLHGTDWVFKCDISSCVLKGLTCKTGSKDNTRALKYTETLHLHWEWQAKSTVERGRHFFFIFKFTTFISKVQEFRPSFFEVLGLYPAPGPILVLFWTLQSSPLQLYFSVAPPICMFIWNLINRSHGKLKFNHLPTYLLATW